MPCILAPVPVPVDPGTLGGRLRAARKRLHLKQNELAVMAKTTQTQLSDWERNVRKPERDNIVKLSQALGVTVEALTGHDQMRQRVDIQRTHGAEAHARHFQRQLDRLQSEVRKLATRLLELAEQAREHLDEAEPAHRPQTGGGPSR